MESACGELQSFESFGNFSAFLFTMKKIIAELPIMFGIIGLCEIPWVLVPEVPESENAHDSITQFAISSINSRSGQLRISSSDIIGKPDHRTRKKTSS